MNISSTNQRIRNGLFEQNRRSGSITRKLIQQTSSTKDKKVELAKKALSNQSLETALY